MRRLLALLALALATPAVAQVQEPGDALAQDAAEWARVSGTTADVAARQLQAQDDTIAVTDALQREFADVKGAADDAAYSLERAVLAIAAARRS